MNPSEQVNMQREADSSPSRLAHEVVFSAYRLFPFESKYTVPDFSSYCVRHDVAPWIAVSVYMVALFVGLRYMKHRKPFSLRAPLFLWNLLLASFSIFGFFRMQQEFRFTYQNRGWRGTYCSKSMDNVVGFWIFVFVMSKFAEFGDTMFLVLRKKPVIFLHWYLPCDRPAVQLLHGHGLVSKWSLVRDDELLRPLTHVQLLCPASGRHPCSPSLCHAADRHADRSDVRRDVRHHHVRTGGHKR